MKDYLRRFLRLFFKHSPVVDTLSDLESLEAAGVVLVEDLPVEYNLADYQRTPYLTNLPEQRLAIDAWPSTPVNRSLFLISNASIVGDEGIVLADGTFLAEPYWHRSIVELQPAYADILFSRAFRFIRGSCFLLPLYWFGNYYHWFSQVLPRLHRVIDLLPYDCQFIVPDSLCDWQLQSLIAVGIDPLKLLKKPSRQKWHVQHLLYASPCAHSAGHTAASVHWLRNLITQNVIGSVPAIQNQLIYITRNGPRRRVLNEEAYLPALRDLGFHIIDSQVLSFTAQVELFSKAIFICAPHGAGLVNMLWASSSCHIFEIFSPSTVDRGCFWDLAQNLGHSYSCFLGLSTSEGTGDDDFFLDDRALLIQLSSKLKMLSLQAS